jgi:hypothetical protein
VARQIKQQNAAEKNNKAELALFAQIVLFQPRFGIELCGAYADLSGMLNKNKQM